MNVKVDASAFDRAARNLEGFPKTMRRKVLELAGGAAAKMLAKEAKARAPVGGRTGIRGWKASVKYKHRPGTMKRAIRERTIQRSETEVVFSIKPRTKRTFYWVFVEKGTKPHSLRRKKVGWKFSGGRRRKVTAQVGAYSAIGGYHPGAKAQPFLAPAAAAKSAEAYAIFRRALAEAVQQAARLMGGA